MGEKRLIENWLPKDVEVLGKEGVNEKSIRRGHISTLHLWWARRPVTSMGAIVLSSLIPNLDNDQDREIFQSFINWEASNIELNPKLSKLFHKNYEQEPPKVFDPFMGGGSTGVAALRLGCDTFGQDSNPVSYLIQLATLVYPQTYGVRLLEQYQRWSRLFADGIKTQTQQFFGDRDHKYFWAKTIFCPNCRNEFPLVRDWWLVNTADERIAIQYQLFDDNGEPEFVFELGSPVGFNADAGTISYRGIVCPICGAKHRHEILNESDYLSKDDWLLAVQEQSNGNSYYRLPVNDDYARIQSAKVHLQTIMEAHPFLVPNETIPLGAAPYLAKYGITKWSGMFNERQLAILAISTKMVETVFQATLMETRDEDLARAVATYLAFAVDQLASKNSALTMWNARRQAAQGTFSRQAFTMTWRYVESSVADELERTINKTADVLRNLVAIGGKPASVKIGDSRDLHTYKDESFDAIVTDPPYYDYVPYDYLSEFFWVWLKRSLANIYPELIAQVENQKIDLTAIPLADESRLAARLNYEEGMASFYVNAFRILKDEAILVLQFALGGVDDIFESPFMRQLELLIQAGLTPTATWPLSTEKFRVKNRPAVATTIVIVCRKFTDRKPAVNFARVRAIIRDLVRKRFDDFQSLKTHDDDYFISAIGPALEIYLSYQQVNKDDGEAATLHDVVGIVADEIADLALVRDFLNDKFSN